MDFSGLDSISNLVKDIPQLSNEDVSKGLSDWTKTISSTNFSTDFSNTWKGWKSDAVDSIKEKEDEKKKEKKEKINKERAEKGLSEKVDNSSNQESELSKNTINEKLSKVRIYIPGRFNTAIVRSTDYKGNSISRGEDSDSLLLQDSLIFSFRTQSISLPSYTYKLIDISYLSETLSLITNEVEENNEGSFVFKSDAIFNYYDAFLKDSGLTLDSKNFNLSYIVNNKRTKKDLIVYLETPFALKVEADKTTNDFGYLVKDNKKTMHYKNFIACVFKNIKIKTVSGIKFNTSDAKPHDLQVKFIYERYEQYYVANYDGKEKFTNDEGSK